jgi:hypothetical protein
MEEQTMSSRKPGKHVSATAHSDVYIAHRGKQSTRAAAVAATGYTIEVRFTGGLSDAQRAAFTRAADRWTHVIVGDLPDVIVDGETINNLLILAEGAPIDGVGTILGQAGPTRLRPASAGPAAFLPAKGEMTFDTADLDKMEADGTLNDVITHEMGHVIGIGTIWTNKKLLKGATMNNPTFVGPNAMREYGQLRSSTSPLPVPVENTGGVGTRNSHWRDLVFGNELMTGFVGAAGNPLSRMTVASLQDIGYSVNMNAAEPYNLPSHLEMAEAGIGPAHAEAAHGIVLPRVPMTLPPESLA